LVDPPVEPRVGAVRVVPERHSAPSPQPSPWRGEGDKRARSPQRAGGDGFSASPPRGEVGCRPGEGEQPAPAQPHAELESIQHAVSAEASVARADALPEIDPPAETGLQLVSDGPPEREQAPALHTGDNVEPLSSIQVLSRLASHAQLFRSADGRFCARVPVGDRLEIFGLTSAGFRDWLIAGFLIYQPEPPSSWAIRRVVGMLEAKARFNTGIPDVFVRVGQDGDDGDDGDSPYFLDLGDPSGRAISISDQGWCVVDRPAVHFRRPEGLRPLPVPVHDGSINLLRSHVNLTEPDFRLMIAWLTAAMRPVGPYPILVLNGKPASGKNWKAFRADQPRILGGLLDAIVGGLHEMPSVDLKELPRMADFAEWGEATSRGLGWGTDTFMTTYDTNRKEATELLLDDSTVANVLLKIARNGVNWSRTAQNLSQGLLKIAGKEAGHRWPKTISMFGNELRRIAPQLRLRGISINFERRRGERFVTLSSDGPNAASGPSNHITPL
jgi:hypothetical protein